MLRWILGLLVVVPLAAALLATIYGPIANGLQHYGVFGDKTVVDHRNYFRRGQDPFWVTTQPTNYKKCHGCAFSNGRLTNGTIGPSLPQDAGMWFAGVEGGQVPLRVDSVDWMPVHPAHYPGNPSAGFNRTETYLVVAGHLERSGKLP